MSNHINDGIRALTDDELVAVSGGTTAHGLGEGGGTGTGTGLGNTGELIRGIVTTAADAVKAVLHVLPF
jgi:hypothetical protein